MVLPFIAPLVIAAASASAILETGCFALAITMLAEPITINLLKRNQVMDVPSQRSSHAVPTARGGGLACLVGIIGAVSVASRFGVNSKLLFIVEGTAFAGLGFADDLRGMPVRIRLVGQLVIAGVASWWSLHSISNFTVILVLECVFGTLWLVAYVNVFNFMDGINGLAALAAIVAGLTFAIIGSNRGNLALGASGAAEAGAALGFLPWNFPNARVFLGDAGSYLLGGLTALLVLVGIRSHLPLECLFGPVALFLTDAGWTLMGRVIRGEDWMSPHKTHIYQRLHQCGLSYRQLTLFLGTVMAACAAFGSLSLTSSIGMRLVGDGLMGLTLTAYLVSPRLFRSREGASV